MSKEDNKAIVRRCPAMSLLTDLDAFSTEHRRCGDLDGDVDAEMVWMTCTCGARMARRVDVDDASQLARRP